MPKGQQFQRIWSRTKPIKCNTAGLKLFYVLISGIEDMQLSTATPHRRDDAPAVRFTRCDFPLPIFLIIDSAHTQRELQLQLEFGVCLGGVFFFQTDKTVLTFQKRLVAFQFQLQLPFLAFRVLLFQCRLCVHCTAGNRCIAGLPTLRGFATSPPPAGFLFFSKFCNRPHLSRSL